MKSNKMMNIARVLLILVLLSTCGLSKTFAKYITQSSSEDKARVAKWGVEVIVEGDAFASGYEKDTETSLKHMASDLGYAIAKESAEILSIDYGTSLSSKVLAPGTSGTLCTVQIKGKPEVAGEIVVTANLTTNAEKYGGGGWDLAKLEYFPIIFSVNNEDYYVGQDGIKDSFDLTEKVNSVINQKLNGGTFQPNDDITNSIVVEWRWNFFHDEYKGIEDPNNPGTLYFTNDKDTALTDPGRLESTISFDLDVQVRQID